MEPTGKAGRSIAHVADFDVVDEEVLAGTAEGVVDLKLNRCVGSDVAADVKAGAAADVVAVGGQQILGRTAVGQDVDLKDVGGFQVAAGRVVVGQRGRAGARST